VAEDTADTGTDNVEVTADKPDELASLRSEMEQMKRELAASRAEKSAESDRRTQAEQRALSAEERRIMAEETACKSTIDSYNTEADNIEAEISRLADEPGHGAEIAKLNRRLSSITAKVQTEEQRQQWLAGQRERAKAEAAAPADTGPKLANGTPLSQFQPVVQQWFKDHPRTLTDETYLKKAIAAASYARDVHGLVENTPEYFEFVEREADGRPAAQPQRRAAQEDEEGEELETTVQRPQTRAAGPGAMREAMAAVAPPSRTAASQSGTGSRRQPLLTAEEKEVADSLFADRFANPADRYVHYADRKKMMMARKPGQFGAN
jgi:chromosome segregation ATPase